MANKLKFSELLEVGLLNDGDYLNIVTTSGVNRRIKFSTLKTAVNDSVGNYFNLVWKDEFNYTGNANVTVQCNIGDTYKLINCEMIK